MSLTSDIERHFDEDAASLNRTRALQVFNEFKFFLNRGEIRAAECVGGEWTVNAWVKKGILLGFRLGALTEVSAGKPFRFFDKNTLPLKRLSLEDGVRVVPGGSAIRDGAFIAPGVICMPPMYVNIGAYVDSHTLIDSHVVVGSCAQIGRNVHLGAGTIIGGVLEPVGDLPVILEDAVMVGGSCGIYDGAIIKKGTVIGAGVVLTESTPVFDVVRQLIYRKEESHPLVIPENAVVVPGSRAVDHPWGREEGLSITTPLIIKYRDAETNASTAREESLR